MTSFPTHDVMTAPEEARPALRSAERRYGYVPNLLGQLADAPVALQGYVLLGDLLHESSLEPSEVQVVLLTASVANGCEYGAATHTTQAKEAGVSAAVVSAIRKGGAVPDVRLEALRDLTREMVTTRGHESPEMIQRFVDAGFKRPQVLEVVLAVAMKTLGDYANHLVHTAVDEPFRENRWSPCEPVTAG